MKKLLSILGSVGMIGTAGATVVACGGGIKDVPQNPADALKSEISKADNLVRDSKKDKSVTAALQAAIEKAQKVSADEKATEQELKDAKDELTKAIDKFNASKDLDPVEVAKNALEARISEADKLVEKAEKEEAAVTKLKAASDEAKATLKEAKDEKTLNDATGKLASAIREYNDAENAKKTIEVGNQKLTVQVGKTISLKVTNAKDIIGLSANSDDTSIGTIKHNAGSDTIAITGVKAGTFNLKLSGGNANPLKLQVTVTA